MNHLKNKRIRSVADLLQDQFGLALVRLENMVRGTICGAIRHKLIPTPQNLVTSTPLTTTFESFFGLHPLSQVLDRTNPLTQKSVRSRPVFGGAQAIPRRTTAICAFNNSRITRSICYRTVFLSPIPAKIQDLIRFGGSEE